VSQAAGPYEIAWAAAARRALERLPQRVAVAVIEFIYGPRAEDPHRVGRSLRFELEGKHAARRGDYRVIYRIDDSGHVVLVLAIGHRADILRRARVATQLLGSGGDVRTVAGRLRHAAPESRVGETRNRLSR
jgi:mRNA interferase RelE/StbE